MDGHVPLATIKFDFIDRVRITEVSGEGGENIKGSQRCKFENRAHIKTIIFSSERYNTSLYVS